MLTVGPASRLTQVPVMPGNERASSFMSSLRRLLPLILGAVLTASSAAAPQGMFGLDLPSKPVSDHVSLTRRLAPGEKAVYASLDGPGCIRRIWLCLNRPPGSGRELPPTSSGGRRLQNRKVIIRIYFDGAETPNVEAPVGDFFGVMHGIDYYAVNTPFVAVKEHNGYECFFEMPFAKSARIEIENAPDASNHFYIQVAWHRYPGQEMREEMRFCAQWRREMPTERYGKDYLLLDADGPGRLIGYFYGLRLIDNVDRWSHGGAENIYLDGMDEHPAFLRGIGGEDAFAVGYGGVLHPPETHLYDGIPYYFAEDTGEARSAQRVVGYRFYVADAIRFNKSIRFQFGTMQNDVCSMVYWYQAGAPRRFVKMPAWEKMLPATELRRGQMDLPLPDHGSWSVSPVLENKDNAAIQQALAQDKKSAAASEGWVTRPTYHGFLDFNNVLRPGTRGAGSHYSGKAAQAVSFLDAPADMTARVRIAWDDRLVLRVNEGAPIDLGTNEHFRARTVEVPLKQGRNRISVTLSNETGTNHGGWTFAFKATAPDESVLAPRAEDARP